MNPNSTPPEGLCARESASGGESKDPGTGAASEPQAGVQGVDPRAVLLDTISTALNRAGFWLAIEGRRAIADAAFAVQEQEIQAWRHKAIQRALTISRLERTVELMQATAESYLHDHAAGTDPCAAAVLDALKAYKEQP